MEYNYYPNSYDSNAVKDKFYNTKDFVKAQILYRRGIEKIINKIIDFNIVNDLILNKEVEIPKILDSEYNFYHNFSSFNSDYVFLRNNIHVEKMTSEELKILLHSDNLPEDFFKNTMERVLFEDGDECFCGLPVDNNLVNSKSIIFEFAYDQAKCTSIKQLNEIHKIITDIFNYIDKKMSSTINYPLSFLIYNSIPDIYNKKEENEENIETPQLK